MNNTSPSAKSITTADDDDEVSVAPSTDIPTCLQRSSNKENYVV